MDRVKPVCRPGDLAVVLGDTVNNGLIVTVLRPDHGWPWRNDWGGLTWWVSCSAQLVWGILEDGCDHVGHEGPLPDAILFPIRGVAQERGQKAAARPRDCLDLPDGRRLTRQDILRARAALPPTRTGPWRAVPARPATDIDEGGNQR